jgi:hypothetical protein
MMTMMMKRRKIVVTTLAKPELQGRAPKIVVVLDTAAWGPPLQKLCGLD